VETPNYIKALLVPNGHKKTGDRRVWGIELAGVWLPFLIATNTTGDTSIPSDCLGAPLRLAFNADGSVKFSKTGRPVFKVVKEVADTVKLVKENFVAGLIAHSTAVAKDNPEGYQAQIDIAKQAAEPFIAHDREKLDSAIAEQMAQQVEQEAKTTKRGKREREAVTA
jgi:hypothetical protein